MSITNTNKHKNDFWKTPEVVRDGVLSLLKENETRLLDPCAGACDLCNLDKYDYELYDINPQHEHVKHGDFFNLSRTDRVIVMNPPFSIGRKFIEHALDIADTVIVICPFSVVKPFKNLITKWYGESWWKSAFYITFPVAAFRLERKRQWTWGYEGKFDYLFENKGKLHINELQPLDPDEQRKGLIFYPSLLGTYHDWNWDDKRTGYRGWVAPLNEKTKEFYTYYTNNCKGHKKGERREWVWFMPCENVEEAYAYYTKCFPTDNWYKVRGITNGHLCIDIPSQWKETWDTSYTNYAETFGKEVLNDDGNN